MAQFPDVTVNAGLDGRLPGTVYLSAHTAFSSTGTNEVTGGSPAYARVLMAMTASTGRLSTNTDAESLNIPASTTVRWIGIWDAVTAGVFRGMVPNGSTKSLAATALDTDVIYAPAHGFANLGAVVFTTLGGTIPTGLTEGTVYFVKTTGKTTDTFSVSAAADDGAAINITASKPVIVSDIVQEVYASQGTLELAAGALDLEGLS